MQSQNNYVVCMPQRKEYIKELFKKVGIINYTLLNAIEPKDLSINDYVLLSNTFNLFNFVLFKKMSKLPVQMSCVMCFLDAIENNYENIIIYEDDITLETTIENINNHLLEFKNSDFQVFYMGYCSLNCNNINNNTLQSIQSNNLLIDISNQDIFCAHAIAYKVKYLSNIIAELFYMNFEFDTMLNTSLKNNNYKKCISKKILFDQNRSNINSLNENSYNNNVKTKVCNFN